MPINTLYALQSNTKLNVEKENNFIHLYQLKYFNFVLKI